MTLLPGEVVLIRIDFHQTPGGKVRPAVVLLDAGDDDFVAAPITSQPRGTDFEPFTAVLARSRFERKFDHPGSQAHKIEV
jgi:hypothetical protein